MLYEFKSKAAGSVLMTQTVAETLLDVLGKTPGPQGIITVPQMAAAIAALEAAVARERAAARPPPDTASTEPEGTAEAVPATAITLAQRAWPMLELLKAAAHAQQPVTWGV